MINIIPRLFFVLGFGIILAGAVLLGERIADPNIKCIKSVKRKVKYYILPLSIIGIGILIIALAIILAFVL